MRRRPVPGGAPLTFRRRFVAALAVMAILAATAACDWRETSSGEPASQAGQELQQAVAASTADTSFRAVQLVTGTVLGADVDGRTEIDYQAPDRVRWLSDRQTGPFLEAVLIGDQAWVRTGEGWRAVAPVTVRPLIFSPLLALQDLPQSADIEVLGDGPEIMGEPTTRYRLERPDFGDTIIAQLGTLAQQPAYAAAIAGLRDAYRDMTAQFEVTVGQQSRRIYVVDIWQHGLNQDVRSHTTFEYGKPVIVQPPA